MTPGIPRADLGSRWCFSGSPVIWDPRGAGTGAVPGRGCPGPVPLCCGNGAGSRAGPGNGGENIPGKHPGNGGENIPGTAAPGKHPGNGGENVPGTAAPAPAALPAPPPVSPGMSLPAPGRALPAQEPLRRHGNIPSLEPPSERWPAPAVPGHSQESTGHPQEPGGGRHRLALQRMAGHLLSLRRRVASLEAENGHLRHSLARLREPEQLRGTDTDVLSRDELLDRLATLGGDRAVPAATLSHELEAGALELRALRDRVQRLQNELIRKNDREKELVLLQRRQQLALRRCQDRAAEAGALQRALRQQDKVIEAMERLLLRDRSAERAADATLAALLAQKRLREEPARPARAARLPGPGEKLELLARLEREQGRARALERQLQEAARSWARGQQELGTRLREREHGLALVSRDRGHRGHRGPTVTLQ
ncbi:coiled-coil domain-containing protein 33 isoform X3 [Agelaius tricolor]|uniref:coiled-coil domain-containing protein 33 isoform X3 n=1 Tax=Agelaius tricolor TaxID=9191 RepID=UPI0039F230CC